MIGLRDIPKEFQRKEQRDLNKDSSPNYKGLKASSWTVFDAADAMEQGLLDPPKNPQEEQQAFFVNSPSSSSCSTVAPMLSDKEVSDAEDSVDDKPEAEEELCKAQNVSKDLQNRFQTDQVVSSQKVQHLKEELQESPSLQKELTVAKNVARKLAAAACQAKMELQVVKEELATLKEYSKRSVTKAFAAMQPEEEGDGTGGTGDFMSNKNLMLQVRPQEREARRQLIQAMKNHMDQAANATGQERFAEAKFHMQRAQDCESALEQAVLSGCIREEAMQGELEAYKASAHKVQAELEAKNDELQEEKARVKRLEKDLLKCKTCLMEAVETKKKLHRQETAIDMERRSS